MRKSFLSLLVLFAGALTSAQAQQGIPFSFRVPGANPFTSGSTLNFSSPGIGQPTALTVTGTYTGNTTVVLSAPQLSGSSDFTLGPLAPASLKSGESFTLTVTYTPTAPTAALGQVNINFTQSSATAGQPGTNGTITLNFNGLVPNFSVNYILPPNNNVTPVPDGGTILFPATLVKTTATATILIANLGTGPGTLNSVAISGAAFQLQGLGILPAGFPASGSTSFIVRYSPVNPGTDAGKLTVTFANQTFTINLAGTGISSLITYTAIDGDITTPVTAGQQITVPDTPIGVLRSVAVQVQNTGTAPAVINSVSSTGLGFTLTDVPFLPITLQPGDSFTFTVNFTPTQAGTVAGTLTIGADRFRLSGNGIGAQFTYSYTAGASTALPVVPGGTVLFSSVSLAQTSTVVFTVTNTGTTSATLTSLGIVGTSSAAFTVGQPPLPAVIAPKSSLSFTIGFTPVVQGLNSGTLLVNGQSFVLSAFGTGVPPLQTFQITGTSGQVQPFTQPSVGLTISQPYPLGLGGQLTMTLNSNVFVTDPAVQFSTGGRSVPFSIAPGATQAVFPNGSTQISLQTGTVSENINIAATFTTQGGSIVTPAIAPSVTLTVGRGVPQLLSASLQTFTLNGFTVNVTGYSTSRSVSKINLQFAGAPGVNVPASSFTVDVSQSAGFYFSSSASGQFGGFFSINIPITVQVTSGSTPTSLVGKFTVTATAVNETGTSNSVTGQ